MVGRAWVLRMWRVCVQARYDAVAYLPHDACASLMPVTAPPSPFFVQIVLHDRVFYCLPLPSSHPAARTVLVSPAYMRRLSSPHIPTGMCTVQKLPAGRIPPAVRAVVETEDAGVARACILNAPLVKSLEITCLLGDTVARAAVVDTEPAGRVCLGTSSTRATTNQSRESGPLHVPALIENPQSSLDRAYNRALELICFPIIYREHLTIGLPKGLLLMGPPGVGKTFLIQRIADASSVPLVLINGPELLRPRLGESEANIRAAFDRARDAAEQSQLGVSVLFIDEIDSIAGKRDSADRASVRIVSQLLTCMDGAVRRGNVVVIGATNRPDALDAAIRRPGRFDREIALDPPTAQERCELLREMTRKLAVACDLREIAARTIGFVAADLAALVREAFLDTLRSHTSTLVESSFEAALKEVGPSLTREYRINVDRSVTWASIGGIDAIKDRLQRLVEWPLIHVEACKRLGLKAPRGILLHGPPGCSKTTIAKAIANTGGFNFYSLSGAALYSCLVGESEALLRTVFHNARLTRPSIIFFDEIDAIVGKRDYGGDAVQERILSTLLNEMDGVGMTDQLMVLGATNRLDAIDAALLRPGRFGQLVHIPLPDLHGRAQIFALYAERIPVTADPACWARKTEGYSGANIKNLLEEAALIGMRNGDTVVVGGRGCG